MRQVLSLQSFRLLALSRAISLLGSQFTLIATPWLVLQLTKDPLILGVVLALEGIPRAFFVLLGGALSDRFPPARVMFFTDALSFLLTGLMSLLLFTSAMQIWMLYAFALAFGLTSGLAIPAANSIVPQLVQKEDLESGNSVIMSITQLASFIGPSCAGILIGKFTHTPKLGLPFAIDALTFLLSATFICLIPNPRRACASVTENIFASILTGARYLWNDALLRFLFLLLTAVNFLLLGPIMVGIPLLADQRLPDGASAFGLLMSAFAGGNLAGYLIAGSLPRPSGALLKLILISFIASFGLTLGALGFIATTWVDCTLLLFVGMGNGYLAILLFSWMQTRAPKEMLGRLMSLLVLSNAGFMALSQLLSGVISKWGLNLLFTSAGALVILTALISSFRPELLTLSTSLTTAKADV